MKRGLSGIYFRVKSDTGGYESTVFEDLTEKQQDLIMKDEDIEWLKGLAKKLAKTIRHLGDELDIIMEG